MINKQVDTIYIAAVDSAEQDKKMADYICDGTADQDVIQAAVDEITKKVENEIRGRRIVLLAGNYYITDFPRENANGKVAVMVGNESNIFQHIGILICGSEHTESTTVHVTRECYDKIDANTGHSIFGCKAHNWNHHVFKDIYVTVPDNQKKIVCFDGRFMGSMGLRRCKCLCENRGDYVRVVEKLPVEGFVAFMGTYGSNNMWEEKWEFCQAEGFGQGFAIGSEHLVIQKCAAVFGRYGYTFNNYPCDFGAIVHPITLISCSDEANANLWKFGRNNYNQCVNALSITFELIPDWFAAEGNFATEENPGEYCGHIEYVSNQGFYTKNDVTIPFWAEGSGINFQTVNNAHKKVCTSAERRTYAAHLGQECFDTTVMKKLIYTPSGWVDALGNKEE